MTPDASALYQHIARSIVATPDEVALAAQLRDNTTIGSATAREAALSRLAAVDRSISLREQGREVPLVPSDPELAAPVLAGLEKFASAVEAQVSSQLVGVSGGRKRWLHASIGAAAVSFLAPVITMLTSDVSSTRVALVAMAVGSAVVGGILCFRVFQSTDETARRLQEKQVSLSFLKSAVDLLEAAPTTQPVLERSFDMFFKHYEGAHAPVSVSDLWPHLGSATDKS